MPRSFLFRLLARDVDFDVSQWFDMFRDARDVHAGDRFAATFRRAADPAQPASAPLASVTATAALAESQPVLTSRFDLLATIGVTVAPQTTAASAGAILTDIVLEQASTGTTGADELIGDGGDRIATVQFGPMLPLRTGGVGATPFDGTGMANYVVVYSEDFKDALVYDAVTRTLLTGGPGDWPELGAGPDDTLELSGDLSAGFTLPQQPAGIDRIVLRPGNDYNLVATDDNVAPGDTLTIDAQPLGADNGVMFDGSAETDGNFEFFGSQTDDFFFGGEGDDRVVGNRGGDTLTGGGGSDVFVYFGAADSSGADYDTIADFDPAADRIDLPGTVAGFADAIEGGALSTATFNDDLAAAAAGLAADQAVWFAPDQGDLAGQIFLIVDGNGLPGYQEGEDYVIAVGGAPLADLTGHTDIFI